MSKGLQAHTLKGSFVWDLPDLAHGSALKTAVAMVANDWQLSGIFTAGSDVPYDISYSFQTGGDNVNLTGSPSYGARVKIVGDTGSGCAS